MLFTRSILCGIASISELYEVYSKTKIVNLGDVEIHTLTKSRPFLYPKTANALCSRFGIPTQIIGKECMRKVWFGKLRWKWRKDSWRSEGQRQNHFKGS